MLIRFDAIRWTLFVFAISTALRAIAGAPANDLFANAQAITGTSATVTGTNASATKEAGEPNHAGYTGGASVWYTWTAPADSTCEINTFGSNFDTLLAVYTGSAVNALTLIASNDEAGGTSQSRVVFSATQNTVYRIAVDGYVALTGNITVNLKTGPLVSVAVTDNHGRENSTDTIAFTYTRTGPTTSALTVNFTFSSSTGYAVSGTDFTAISSVQIPIGSAMAVVTITPIDDAIFEGPELVQIITSSDNAYIIDSTAGSALATLDDDEAPSNDNFANAKVLTPTGQTLSNETNINSTVEAGEPNHAGVVANHTVWYSFTPAATTVAFAEITFFGGANSDSILAIYTGSSVNALTPVASNDDISTLSRLSRVGFLAQAGTTYFIAMDGYLGAVGTFTISLTLGQRVTIDTLDSVASERGPSDATVRISRDTPDNSAPLSVNVSYTGATNGTDFDALPSPAIIPAGSNSLTLTIHPIDDNILEGTEFLSIQLSSGTGYTLSGSTSASITIYDNEPGPPNDNFANAIAITGALPQTVTGSITLATAESGEPRHDNNLPVRSVWWSWNAPSSGPVTIDLNGSTPSTYMGVYTGNSLTNLTRIASDDFASTRSKVGFIAAAGTTYFIAVDGTSDGPVTVNLKSEPNLLIVTSPDNLANEGTGDPGTFMIRRPSTTGALSITYFLSGSVSSSDYTVSPPSPVAIPDGQDNVIITVTPTQDTTAEGDETVAIFPSATGYFVQLNDKFEFIRIIDDDTALPRVDITALTDAAEAGLVAGAWRISRSGPTTNPLIVSISSSGATAGSDYQTLPASVTILAGQSFVDLPLVPIDDNVVEGDEFVTLSIQANAASYTIGNSFISIRIRDDDRPPNDNFASRTVLTSGSTTATGTTLNATTELGEPAHDALEQNPRGSVWWTWTAPSNGAVNLAISGSVVYSVYTGNSLATLTRVATSTNGSMQFIAQSGVVYQIGVDRSGSTGGNVSITLDFFANQPTVELTVPDASASEAGLDPGMFLFTRTGDTTNSLTVNFTVGGTATSGTDYTSLGTSVVIPAGQPSVSLPVNVIQDTTIEGQETVTVTVSSSATYVRKGATAQTVTIDDDDFPANDLFVNRINLNSNTGAFTGTNANASKEKGEPNHYSSGGKSVWWSWTAPATATARISTDGSNFDTLLGIYTGSNVAQLTLIGSDDDNGAGNNSLVTFPCVAGTIYQIAVDGYSGAQGSITLNIDIGAVIGVTVTDASASEQATDTGTFRITRVGQISSSLTVNFTLGGTALNGTDYQTVTTSVTFNANETQKDIVITPIDDALQEGPETVTLSITANASYFLGTPSTGSITIADNEFPINDNFAQRITLNGTTASHAGNNANGTTEAGEPNHGGIGRSIWYSYTPATDGVAQLSTTSSFSTQVAVYSGSNVGTLTLVKSGTSPLLVGMTNGTTYQIAIDSRFTDNQGAITTNLNYSPGAQILSFGALDTNISEAGVNPGSFVLQRQGSTTSALTVNFAVTGSATQGSDYMNLGTSATILAGQTSVTVPIVPIDDSEIELTENIIVTLQTAAGYVIEGPNFATFTLTSDDLPTNDNFANRITMSGIVANVSGGNIGCTKEAGEPNHGNTSGGASVWWTWTAPNSVVVQLDTIGSTFNTTLGVYTGSNVAALTSVGQDDDSAGGGLSRVIFTATQGTTYHFAVDGNLGQTGLIKLNLIGGTVVTVAAGADTAEGGAATQFTLTRAGDITQALTVNYTISGSAINGTDYATIPTSVQFAANVATMPITITPTDDNLAEPDETVTITLASSPNYFLTNTPSATLTIADNDFVDLQVTSITVPALVYTDRSFEVSWTLANASAFVLNQAWTDKVYLSSDTTLDGNDKLLGTFPASATIAANGTLTRTQSFTLPRSGAIPGNYRIIVQTDSANQVKEANENNNITADDVDFSFQLEPLPDLIVSNITVPPSPFSNTDIQVTYTVKNVGNAPTDALQWLDQAYLSSDDTIDASDTQLGGTANILSLNPNESYTTTVNFHVPIGLSGAFNIVVKADKSGSPWYVDGSYVKESDETNNKSVKPMVIQLTPPPDLQVQSVTAPANAFSGDQISLSWTVKNTGPGDVPPQQQSWIDAVYLSADATLDVNTDIKLGEAGISTALASNASYTVSNRIFTLPEGIFGNFYVFVLTDKNGNVFENIGESNNSSTGTLVKITLTPPPDLIVSNVNAPSSAIAGRPVAIEFTVSNQGPGVTRKTQWTDTVYISVDNVLNTSTDTKLGDLPHSGALDGGTSYTATLSAPLPPELNGNYFVFVVTDSGNAVFEFDPGFDANANNKNFDTTPMNVIFSPPDLTIPTVNAPATGVTGQSIPIQFTVNNQGTGDTFVASWNDRVYLSTNIFFNPATSIKVADIPHSGVVLPGASYTVSQSLVVPLSVDAGIYYVYVQSDADNKVAEVNQEGNNTGRTTGTITITAMAADLQVTAVGAPPTASTGQNINVSWTVTNAGNGATDKGSWNDAVYLSTDAIYDSNDTLLKTLAHVGTLSPTGNYTVNTTVTIPSSLSGSRYLIVRTDVSNEVFERTNENNNAGASTQPIVISVASLPDLVITNVTSPASATESTQIAISYTVKNNGTGTATPTWNDRVYLSRDQVFDSNDLFIASVDHSTALAPTDTYTQNLNVNLPQGAAGPYYVFVLTDRSNRVLETNEDNNDAYNPTILTINLAPQSDLSVNTVSGPATANVGQSVPFNVVVQNNAAVAITQSFLTRLYLSTDNVFDNSDILFATINDGNVPASGTSNKNINAAIPPVTPGNYYVIARTDARNTVRETDENNNIGASAAPIAIDATPLILGTPFNGAWPSASGGEFFFKLNVPVPGEDLRIFVDSAATSGNVEVYVAASRMPTRSDYDFLEPAPFEVDQEIIIPRSQQTTYYIYLRCTQATGGLNFSLLAELLTFGIRKVDPPQAGNTGPVTFQIDGSKFDETTTFDFIDSANAVFPSVRTRVLSSTRVLATVNMKGAAAGLGDFKATKGATVNISNDCVTVVPGATGELAINLRVPPTVRLGQTGVWYVEYGNVGKGDLALPLLELLLPGIDFFSATPNGAHLGDQILVLGLSNTPLRSTLRPGEFVRVQFFGRISTRIFTTLTAFRVPEDVDGEDVFEDGTSIADAYHDTLEQIDNNPDPGDRPLVNIDFGFTYPVHEQPPVSVPVDALVELPSDFDPLPDNDPPVTSRSVGTRAAGDCVPKTHVIIVGDSDYTNRDATGNTNLGGQNAARRWRDYFKNLQGDCKPARIFTRTDGAGAADDLTPQSVRAVIRGFRGQVQACDRVKFIYNGHGFANGNLCLNTGQISPAQLGQWLNELNPNPGKPNTIEYMVIIDSCFSGKFCKDLGDSIDNLSSIAASSPTQVSWANGGGVGGELSNSLLDRLEAGDNIKQAFFDADEKIKNAHKNAAQDRDKTDPQLRNFHDQDLSNAAACNKKKPRKRDRNRNHRPQRQGVTDFINSRDPNEKKGPAGYGEAHVVGVQQPLDYVVSFENQATATGAARVVTVTDNLAAGFDARSFRLTEIAFWDQVVKVPANRSAYQTRVQLSEAQGSIVADVFAGIDVINRQIFLTLSAIDPLTGEAPTDPALGILPPNDALRSGEGHMSFTLKPATTLNTGDTISNIATIVFDTNEEIMTNSVSNPVDAVAPSSNIGVLPVTVADPHFVVTWSGTDDANGTGVKDYDIYVSDNGSPYTLWLGSVVETSATFPGETGHTYRFYSRARDNTENLEAAPATFDQQVAVTGTLNFRPVATPDSLLTERNKPLPVSLKAVDNDGGPVNFVLVSTPQHGTLSGTLPNLTYTPAQDFRGQDTFSFRANDGQVDSEPAAVAIVVNVAPVANNLAPTTQEDTALPVTLSGSDEDSDPLTFAVTVQPQHGTLSGSGASLMYAPAANYFGPDTFTYTANDGKHSSAPASVSITVNSVNDVPVANNSTLSTNAGIASTGTLSASDVENSPLTFAVGTPPAKGTVTINAATGAYQYTPDAAASGDDSFTFTANDGAATSAPAQVKISITAAPPPPPKIIPPTITSSSTASGAQLQPFNYKIEASGSAPITFSATDLPAGLALSGDTITGAPESSGIVMIPLTASNSAGSDSKTLTLTIAHTVASNQAPVVASRPSAVPNPGVAGQVIQFTATATDADDTLLLYTWDFGDGTAGSGNTVQHTYAVEGLYNAKVSVFDGTGETISTVSVVVNPNEDVDLNKFRVTGFTAKLDFVKKNKDSLTFGCAMPIPTGFKPAQKSVTFVAGTARNSATLDAKGKGTSGPMSVKLTGKLKSGAFTASPANLTVTFKGASLAEALAEFGLRNVTTDKKGVHNLVSIVIVLDETGQVADIPVLYKSTERKSGSAKLEK